jgi:hypothetical protein
LSLKYWELSIFSEGLFSFFLGRGDLDRVSLCSPDWLQIWDPPSVSWAVGLAGIIDTSPHPASGCFLVQWKCNFSLLDQQLSESMHWVTMLPLGTSTSSKSRSSHFSMTWRIQHSDPEKMPPHLSSTLHFPLCLLPAFCPFQVPVLLELWESRCLVIAYLAILSILPPGWNPPASVRRTIMVFLGGPRFYLQQRAVVEFSTQQNAKMQSNPSHWLDMIQCHSSPCYICFFVVVEYW